MRRSRRSGANPVWYLLLAGATEEEPSASAAAVPWTAAGAGELAAAAEGRAGAGSGRGGADGRGAGLAAELGPAETAAPRWEVSAGGVGPWRTRGQKE